MRKTLLKWIETHGFSGCYFSTCWIYDISLWVPHARVPTEKTGWLANEVKWRKLCETLTEIVLRLLVSSVSFVFLAPTKIWVMYGYLLFSPFFVFLFVFISCPLSFIFPAPTKFWLCMCLIFLMMCVWYFDCICFDMLF